MVLDTFIWMEAQITNIAKLVFYQLHKVRELAPFLSPSDLATVIHATVSSRVDYCNSLYAGLPLILIWKLQLVQKAVVWVLMGMPWTAYIQSVLRHLHWLLAENQLRFKVLVLTFKALRGLGPMYLWEFLW